MLINTTIRSPQSTRLDSLDILRGFVLFLLVFFQPILMSLNGVVESPVFEAVAYQFSHAQWEGIRFWDMVMPMFLFMTGIAMPFSFQKYKRSDSFKPVYMRICRRVLLLWLLGMVVQGNLLALDIKHVYLYSNTLQAIAAGYLIASVFQLHLSFKNQVIATGGLLAVFTIPMLMFGDFSPTGNFAEQVDRAVLGRFRDGVDWESDGTWIFSPHYYYTWIWSSLTFAATVMLGVIANRIVMQKDKKGMSIVKQLLALALGLIILGLLSSLIIPIIKPIWSSSMVLYTGGFSFLALALFYFWIDVREHKRGFGWLKVYGMNSILAYVLAMVVNFRCIATSTLFGLEQYLGVWYSPLIELTNFGILFFILLFLKQNKIFIRV